MLKLLLDEHLSPHIAAGLRRRNENLVVRCVSEWEDGRFLGLPDDLLLKEAALQSFTLTTYDRRTVPPLLMQWMEEGRDHGGVIFVDAKTIRPSNFGALIRGLDKLWSETRYWDWTNRIIILSK